MLLQAGQGCTLSGALYGAGRDGPGCEVTQAARFLHHPAPPVGFTA